MSASRSRLARLLPGILGPLLACSAVHAQIHEEKPAPGLEEGVLVHFERRAKANAVHARGRAIGTGDFSLAFRFALTLSFHPDSKVTLEIATASDAVAGWRLLLGTNGALSFVAQSKITGETAGIKTPEGSMLWSGAHEVVVSVHRDVRQPFAGIWVDGVEVASATFGPLDLGAALPTGPLDAAPFWDEVTVYNRALTRPEILELSLRSSRREEAQTSGSAAPSNAPKSVPPHVGSYEFPNPKHPAPPPNGPRFIPQPNETIALIGGTEAVALAESGELEALMLMAFPQTRFHFRSLAWEGDTVFKQDRPMNFGPLDQQLRRVNAGAVFVMFGRQECLEAKDEGGRMKDEKSESAAASSLDSFKTAFEKLLSTVAKVTPNIVVIGPVPFEKKRAPLPDLSGRNELLGAYSDAMEAIALNHEAAFSNLAGNEAMREILENQKWTLDGIQMNDAGRFVSAVVALAGLNLATTAAQSDDYFKSNPEISRLTPAIQSKNRLWHDYWRPSNWAFLHGDRTNQPSSRDPVNPQIRFFPAEQEKYLPLIKDAEEKVFQLVEEAQKKLP